MFGPDGRLAWRRAVPASPDRRGGGAPPHTRHLPHTHYSYTYELSEVYYPSMSSLALGNKSCQVSKHFTYGYDIDY